MRDFDFSKELMIYIFNTYYEFLLIMLHVQTYQEGL